MKKLAVIAGIRPDLIRLSSLLRLLEGHRDISYKLIHTGQHYDANLNDIFYDELEIRRPDIQLNCAGKNHNEQHSKLIIQLSDVLEELRPDVCLFLGDSNATIGGIVPLKLSIPIIHWEAGMRSFNWYMPEERNRVLLDRMSDVHYVYHQNHLVNLVREGYDPTKIVVTGNNIIDALMWGFGRKLIGAHRLDKFQVEPRRYILSTLHRNENINGCAQGIINHIGEVAHQYDTPVLFIEMPRVKALGLNYPKNFYVSPPIGFFDFVSLEQSALLEFTDSGTNQEVAAILGTPCVVTRDCTERPEYLDYLNVMAREANINKAAKFVIGNWEAGKTNKLWGPPNAAAVLLADLERRLETNTIKNWRDCINNWKLERNTQFGY